MECEFALERCIRKLCIRRLRDNGPKINLKIFKLLKKFFQLPNDGKGGGDGGDIELDR